MDFIRTHILNDWKLKVLSLVLAAMLWFAVSYMAESRMGVPLQIGTVNLSKEYMIKRMDPTDIVVTVSGPGSILKNIGAKDIKLSVDMSGVKNGRYTYSLKKSNVQTPQGVQVEEIRPDYLIVEVDRSMEKSLRVVVNLEKQWMNVYGVKSWNPPVVTVYGSRESLEQREIIHTLPVGGLFKKEEEEAYVGLDARGMIIEKVTPDTVRVILKMH
jgi:YbbR domain-containing protein